MSDKEDKKSKDRNINDLDKELDQTFPASDPPSHTRPGEHRPKEEKEEDNHKK